ncbi:capsular biosynthesis protein [Corynebacterium sp. HMSC075D04]|uniref:capsular biosynthesis protein n=1 Tax=Corynebacterium sp. HMSC075D04 TaxID=1739540 RepID=UPI0009F18144
MKRLIVDVDDTISFTQNGDYACAQPNLPVIERLREYKNRGFEIVFHSSRNVRTFEGNLGKINAHTLPTLIEWLDRHQIPYDEIYMGKPWCGSEGFYVDDKAVRPDEFAKLSYLEICELIGLKK